MWKIREEITVINQKNNFFRYVLFVGIANFVITALFIFFGTLGFLESVENNVVALEFRLRGAVVPKNVVIATIDDRSLSASEPWPWSRKTMANLIEKIAQQNPKAIGINIAFEGKSSYEDDNLLSNAISKNGRTVIVYYGDGQTFKSLHSLTDKTTVPYFGPVAYPLFVRNEEGIIIGINCFSKNISSSKGNKPFALAVAEMADNSVMIEKNKNSFVFLTNLIGPGGSFSRISAIDIINGVSEKKLAGKMVLIGISAEGMNTLEQTFWGNMDTTEVQANIIETILQGCNFSKIPVISALVIFLFNIIFVIFLNKKTPILFFSSIIGFFASCYILFSVENILIPITPFLFLLLLNNIIYYYFPPLSRKNCT